ncbi:hypothetical protein N7478_008057 [Penicillium angulare]|uniref:uncharacterized protein n=1 Tax=Penicillium angulare TaxID=116970 RepID=UPI002541088D|nr:uncharacterized protein N7478_008057 [Penicillium angulare]KAJ5272932.1 hypothetical protein N7478_008057 [Penicillium angulare]
MASSFNNNWEAKGEMFQKSMESAKYNGKIIRKARLTITDLIEDDWSIIDNRQHLTNAECHWIQSLDLPPNFDHKAMTLTGRTGPGVIFVEVINRMAGNDFYISDLMKLVYEQNFPLNGLKHIFAVSVKNTDTTDCYQKICQKHGIDFRAMGERTWNLGSSEFKALLGCGIGKAMASFVLCAFGQGVKRISRIVIWRDRQDLNMRFDIENV